MAISPLGIKAITPLRRPLATPPPPVALCPAWRLAAITPSRPQPELTMAAAPLPPPAPASPRPRAYEWLLVCALVVAVAQTHQALPVTQMSDARYSLLVSTALLEHGDFALESYVGSVSPQPMPLPLSTSGGHLVYRYPPVTPILSIPFVWWQARAGMRPLDRDGHYSAWREETMQRQLAACLVALTCGLLYWLLRPLLPAAWTTVLVAIAAWGTPLLSTASRALWNQTWGTLLLVVVLLVMQRMDRRKPRTAVILGTLTAWMYESRPTWSVLVAAVGLWWLFLEQSRQPEPQRRWLLLFLRRQPLVYSLTVLAWLVPFVVYAWTYWHHPLPAYYRSPMGNPAFVEAVLANLVSPARGLLVYCPFLLPAGLLLWRTRDLKPAGALTGFAAAYLLVHLVVISLNVTWWGGGSYGPRFMTDVVPLFALLMAAALAGWRARPHGQTWLVWAMALLTPIAVLLHLNGAANPETWEWNRRPIGNTRTTPMWSWTSAQFLAGLSMDVPPYTLGTRVDLGELPQFDRNGPTSPGSWPFLLRGWWGPEPGGAWTSAPLASLRWQMTPPGRETHLHLALHPAVPVQTAIRVNGVELWTGHVKELTTLDVPVPAAVGGQASEWTVDVVTEKTVRPELLGINLDRRTLGVKVGWVEVR